MNDFKQIIKAGIFGVVVGDCGILYAGEVHGKEVFQCSVQAFPGGVLCTDPEAFQEDPAGC